MKFTSTCILLAMAGISLFAEPFITDGEIKAQFENGSVKVYDQKAEKLIMTLKPNPAIQKPYAETAVVAPKRDGLLVRGENGSFAVIITDRSLQVTGSSGIKNLDAVIKTGAVVLPDAFAEDDIVVPQEKALRVPNFLPYFRVLANDGDVIVDCILNARPSDVSFRKENDETIFTFPQSNGENMIFTFLRGKGVWTKVDGLTTEFKDLDWTPPFSACYTASMPYQGYRCSYPMLEPGNQPYNYRVGMSFVTISNLEKPNPPTLWHTNTSFISYPFIIKDGKAQIRIPVSTKMNWLLAKDFSPDNIYIYASGPIVRGKGLTATPADQVFPVANPRFNPQKYLPTYARGPFAKSRIFVFPATCASTNKVEKAFVNGTIKKQSLEMRTWLNKMDLFVADIRARIEQYMRWSEDMKIILKMLPDYEKEYEPILNEFQKTYDQFAPKMKKVDIALELSRKMRKLIDAEGDEEQLEEDAKKLGRAIRDLGGAQDSCLGHLRKQAKKIRAKLLRSYVYGTPDKLLDWKISAMFDDMDKLLNGYIGMEGK